MKSELEEESGRKSYPDDLPFRFSKNVSLIISKGKPVEMLLEGRDEVSEERKEKKQKIEGRGNWGKMGC